MKTIQDVAVRGMITRAFIVIEYTAGDQHYTEQMVGCFYHHSTAKSFAMHMNARKTSDSIQYLIVETDIDNSKLEFI